MSQIRDAKLAEVRKIWEKFCESGDPAYLRGLPGYVAESWARSRQHGIDPGLKRFPLDEAGPNLTQEEHSLLEVVLPVLKPYERELYDCSAFVAISGRAGRIIHRYGNRWALEAADRINAVVGAMPRESTIGTNSLGTTLHLRSSVGITRWEHFCEAFWEWSDIGVPLTHPVTGDVLGAIDLGLYKHPLRPAFGLAIKAMVAGVQAAIRAQHEALGASFQRQAGARKRDHALVAVDRFGCIVAATPGAAGLVASDGRPLEGRMLEEFPDLVAGRLGSTLRAPSAGERLLVAGKDVGQVVRLDGSGQPMVPQPSARSRYAFEHLHGTSDAFVVARAFAQRVARTDLSVLLIGETGTGKELVAQAIHSASARSDGPFVAVNCGAIPSELVASELFGYERGAFTGAHPGGRRGKFELADGGTLFLDEITETGPAFQVNLLRVLEDGEFVPVGAEKARRVNVRVVSASNRDPKQAIAEGLLREDLYYRLKGALIRLPPLRERKEDLAGLVAHFCSLSRRPIRVSADALELLRAYSWPGNVRELRSVIQSAAAMTEGDSIGVDDLPAELRETEPESAAVPATTDLNLRGAERDVIQRAMERCGGNVLRAAQLLGMSRSSLYRKLDRLQLNRGWKWQR